jgi:hypothetical protein
MPGVDRRVLDNYCRANPTDAIAQLASKLAVSLHPKR